MYFNFGILGLCSVNKNHFMISFRILPCPFSLFVFIACHSVYHWVLSEFEF